MEDKHILKAGGAAFLLLYPGDLIISIAELNSLVPLVNKDAVYISNDPWLFYQPVAEEDIYSWEIPGIKLVFNGTINYEAAKEIASHIVEKLKEGSGMEITLVAVDKTKLAVT